MHWQLGGAKPGLGIGLLSHTRESEQALNHILRGLRSSDLNRNDDL